MAYGGLQGQAPQGVAPINGLPTNDVRELTVRSGYDISAGDVVDVEGGEVFKNVSSSPITPLKNSTLAGEICVLNNNIFLMAYPSPSSSRSNINIRSYSYDIKSNTVTELKSIAIPVGDWSEASSYLIGAFIKANDTQAVLSYNVDKDSQWYTYLLSISVNSSGEITYKILNTITNRRKSVGLVRLSDREILNITSGYEYGSYNLYGEFLTINPNSIVYSAPVVIYNDNDLNSLWCSTPIDNYLIGTVIGNSNKIILYKISNKKLTAVGNGWSFNHNLLKFLGTAQVDGVNYVVTKGVSSNTFYNIFPFTTTSIEHGLDGVVINGTTSSSYPLSVLMGKYLIDSRGNTLNLYKITPNGFSKLKETTLSFNPTAIGVIDNDNGFISGNNSAIFSVYNDELSGAPINSSKTAIALQSASSGQPISVGFGGYCPCDGIVEGQTITSSGVMGYGVQDGWLDVRPAYWGQSIRTID